MKKTKQKRATITLEPGAILSNVKLDGCFVVIRAVDAQPVIRECIFHNLPAQGPAIQVRSNFKGPLKPVRRARMRKVKRK